MYVYEALKDERVRVRIDPVYNLDSLKNHDFGFDWSSETGYDLFKVTIIRSDQWLGLISIESVPEELRIEIRLLEIAAWNIGSKKRYQRVAGILIAYACKLSFDYGFYGFVSLIPKTQLIEHYKKKYGFKEFGRHLAIELESSELLMNKYLTND